MDLEEEEFDQSSSGSEDEDVMRWHERWRSKRSEDIQHQECWFADTAPALLAHAKMSDSARPLAVSRRERSVDHADSE